MSKPNEEEKTAIDAAAKTGVIERSITARHHSKHCRQTMADIYVLAEIRRHTIHDISAIPNEARRKKQALHKKSRIKQGAADVNGNEAKIALLNTPFSFFDRSLMAKPCQTVENPWSARKGRISLELPIVPGGVYSGCGAIESGGKSHFPDQKSFHCSFCVGSLKDFRENRQGGESLLPRLPACQNLFNGLSWRCHAILPPWACSPPRFREEPEKTSFAKRVGFFALRPETPRSRSRRRFSSARKKRLRARKSGAKARRTVCFQNRALSGFMKPDVSTMSG